MKRLAVVLFLMALVLVGLAQAWAYTGRPEVDHRPDPHLHLCIPKTDPDIVTCTWP